MPQQTEIPRLTKQECVSLYAEAGFTLFPLNGKVPVAGCRWRKVDFNPFPSFVNNFGVCLKSDDLVIDVDPRNGGNESIKAFMSALNLTRADLNTFTVKTGSGGFHVYLKKPAEFPIKQTLKDYRGIDFLSSGHYVVGGGSVHPNTGLPYQIAHKGPSDIIQAPLGLLDALKRTEIVPTKGTEDYVDDEQTRSRFSKYLEIAPLAIEGEGGDKTTFAVCAVGHDLGLSPTAVLEIMLRRYNDRCVPPWDPEELKRKVYNAYKYTEGNLGSKAPETVFEEIAVIDKEDKRWDRDLHGGLKKNHNNMTMILTGGVGPLGGLLGYNLFMNDIVFLKPAPWHRKGESFNLWTDEEALKCKYWLSHVHKFEPPTVCIHEAAIVAAQLHCFHPVKEYLEKLTWDGHKRVHNWLIKYMGAEDNEYVRAVGIKTLVAAVMRIYEPGCKFDYMMVIEGKQGTGKSRTLAALASPWFSDQQMDITNKDIVDNMRGKWLIEAPEMETHYRSETQAMKAFLARGTDRVRPAYARVAKDFPRQCIFIGTVNPEEDDDIGYLKDTTGNRRYWPIKTTTIDVDAIKKVKDQLWAETVHLYKTGCPVFLDDEKIIARALVEQKARLGRDAWHNQIANWLDFNEQASTYIVVTGQQVFTDCIGGKLSLYSGREMRRISNVMQELGWSKGVHRDPVKNDNVRGYKRPVIR